MKSRIK